MFSYMSMEDRIPQNHPLRAMRSLVDAVLTEMSPRFTLMYANTGRPSIAPEKLLRAQLLQILSTIRSERLLMEELDYNLLFRWFVELTMDDAVWDATVFMKNRERLLAGPGLPRTGRGRGARERFSVDSTLIEAWASVAQEWCHELDRIVTRAWRTAPRTVAPGVGSTQRILGFGVTPLGRRGKGGSAWKSFTASAAASTSTRRRWWLASGCPDQTGNALKRCAPSGPPRVNCSASPTG